MKKRFLSVLLVSAMGVAALAGCGGGNTSADNGSTAADQMGAAVEDKTDAELWPSGIEVPKVNQEQ